MINKAANDPSAVRQSVRNFISVFHPSAFLFLPKKFPLYETVLYCLRGRYYAPAIGILSIAHSADKKLN